MNIFGIGPRIALSGIASIAAVIFSGSFWGPTGWWFIPGTIRILTGTALVTAGVYFWLDSVRLIATRFKSDVLITDGVYRLVRNPMYAAFIVFIVPGVSLLLNNRLIILSSIVMLLVFKLSIHKEEEYLLKMFGNAYRDYVRKVRQIIPFLW